jgi:hypothetical protein
VDDIDWNDKLSVSPGPEKHRDPEGHTLPSANRQPLLIPAEFQDTTPPACWIEANFVSVEHLVGLGLRVARMQLE